MDLPLLSSTRSLKKVMNTSKRILKIYWSFIAIRGRGVQGLQSAPSYFSWATLTMSMTVSNFMGTRDSPVARALVSRASCAIYTTLKLSSETESNLLQLKNCVESNSSKCPMSQVVAVYPFSKSIAAGDWTFKKFTLTQCKSNTVQKRMEWYSF